MVGVGGVVEWGVGGFPDNGHHSEGESPAALVCLVALVGWLPWPPSCLCIS